MGISNVGLKGMCPGVIIAGFCVISYLIMVLFPALRGMLILSPSLQSILIAPWKILTYQFVHIGALHLMVNVIGLLWMSRQLSGAISASSFIILFIGGSVCGALTFLVTCGFSGDYSASLAGASAGVFALVAATACLGRKKWVVIFFLPLVLLYGSASAHAGGLIFGFFAVCRGLIADLRVVRKISERRFRLLSKVRMSGYAALSDDEKRDLERLTERRTVE